MTVHAVFENGVFRPTTPVELPEHSAVTFEPRMTPASAASDSLEEIYEIMGRSHETGIVDLAAGHDEHQP